jgi:eukaryotic-like serine/threonine-protein kinase
MGDDSGRWARVDEVFSGALGCDLSTRDAYLARACGTDEALRREVEALLASVTSAEAAIGDSAGDLYVPSGPLVDAPDATLPAGTPVGPYVVRQLVGRGGMGAVYSAVRADGSLAREVALKVGRPGASAAGLALRLRREQRILASLEHPGIARLYDAGVTTDGVPYLVMELVSGTRIDEYVRDRALGVPEVLQLFEQVCEAVAFAHQRFVVHRDLKPANILIDAQGRVRLLDFGIARLIAEDETAGDTLTRPGQLILTPEYASPEQARGEPASASMDVYALGVLLHEVLTGTRPSWQRLVMTQQAIATVEAAMRAPSTGINDPVRRRALRGDLDHVILTALAPDATRRYATVHALHDDLRRVRDGKAIGARRPGMRERVWRTVRRNPVLSAAWSLVALLTVAFVASTLVQNTRIASERDRANAERDLAAAQRDRARSTSRILASIFESGDPMNAPGSEALALSQALDRGLERVQRELATQPAARAELLTAIGKAYTGLGRYDNAQAVLDSARVLQAGDTTVSAAERAVTLSALGLLASARGQRMAAESLHTRALVLRTDSTRADSTARASAPAVVSSRELAMSLVNVGGSHLDARRFDSARVYLDSGIALLRSRAPNDSAALAGALNNRATLAMRSDDFPLATRLATEALQLNRAALGAEHPRVAGEMANLAFLLDRTERRAEAEAMAREALRIADAKLPPQHVVARSVRILLGNILSRTGRLEEAERRIAEVVAIERRLPEARAGLAMTLDNYAGVLDKLGRRPDALTTYREALAAARANAPDEPGVAILQGKVADMACRTDGPTPETFGLFDESLIGLARAFPEAHPFRIGGRGTRASCLLRTDRRDEGERELVASFDAARRGDPRTRGMARMFGSELHALYTRVGNADAVRRIQAQLDSIPDTGSR